MKLELKTAGLVVAATLVLAAAGCSRQEGRMAGPADSTAPGAPSSSTAANTLPPPPGLNIADTDFVNEAASGGMMEVQLGQHVADNGQNAKIKAFAQMMVKDHSAANEKLATLAQGKQITLPTTLSGEHAQQAQEMTALKGSALDKAYAKMMVDDHEKDIAKFEQAAQVATDADVKAFAESTLPVLREHLKQAQALPGAAPQKSASR